MVRCTIYGTHSRSSINNIFTRRRRPMLPTRLSESLCSLQENQMRFAFVCEITVENNAIIDVNLFNSLICVYKIIGMKRIV